MFSGLMSGLSGVDAGGPENDADEEDDVDEVEAAADDASF